MGGHTFEEIKSKWDVIFKDPLLSLTSLRDKGVRGNVCSFSLRSVCWKLYLSYLPSLDISTWTLTLHKERQHYADLRQKYITSPVSETENDNTSNDLSVNNPLSLDQANPWQEYFKDTELRKIIRQDVERTFPDNEYFRNPEAQNRLLDILFIYCKMNTDVSYRQGMHELLAPILWVVDDESIPSANGYAVENDEITIIRQTLNSDYVEHDTFVLFSSLMKAAKINYEYNDEVFNRRPKRSQGTDLDYSRMIKEEAAKLTPVVMRCNKIYEEYLQKIDPDLFLHLNNLEIEPQLYGIRWVRLLFGREFTLEKVLILWDGMFAEDPTLRIVDFVCLTMMLLIRDELLESDYAGCLSKLMRYPPIDEVELLVSQAIYLRDHLSIEGGRYIIQQNAIRSGKSITSQPLPDTIESNNNNNNNSSSRIEGLVPDSLVHVTKNVFDTVNTGMLNKAISSVVGEVKKNLGNSRNRNEQDNQRRQNSTSDFINKKFYSNLSQQVSNDPLRTERPDRTDTSKYNNNNNNNSIKNNLEEFTKLREQNRQMSIILQKSIDILEQEILGRTKSQEDTDKIEKSSEGSTSRSSFEYVASNNNEESSTVPSDGISVLNVLHGLKHIRDVLNGSMKEFNSNILDFSSSDISNTSNNSTEDHEREHENEHWEVVDDGISVLSVPGTEDEIASIKSNNNTKQEKSIAKSEIKSIYSSIPSSSFSSSLPSLPIMSSSSETSSSSPLSRNTIDNASITTATTTTTSSSTPTTPTARTPRIPKRSSKLKLKLEDILYDVENNNGTPKSSITSNSKYSWMIEGYTDDDDNSLFNPKRASIGSINSLSSYASGSGYGSGYADYEEEYLKKILPTTTTTTTSTISPTQRRSKNPISTSSTATPPPSSPTSLSTSTPTSLSGGKIDPLGATPFTSKNIEGRNRSESIGSISSTTSNNDNGNDNDNSNNNNGYNNNNYNNYNNNYNSNSYYSNNNHNNNNQHSITSMVEDPLGVL
ncbi:hypothetical protein Glove_519g19 [Diversispora epigaea]|uniref:Rab-GAP TBC domain-containing protein n=1 Tax=Diversispora epigaea TaxID=1348612 RepID=A0A397GIP1_9GLOM|nr:hypothetical protein Glove_519g19 [Diversispora epigaea]